MNEDCQYLTVMCGLTPPMISLMLCLTLPHPSKSLRSYEKMDEALERLRPKIWHRLDNYLPEALPLQEVLLLAEEVIRETRTMVTSQMSHSTTYLEHLEALRTVVVVTKKKLRRRRSGNSRGCSLHRSRVLFHISRAPRLESWTYLPVPT